MRILLAGHSDCISEGLLEQAFSADQVTILGRCAVKPTADRRIVVMDWPEDSGGLAAVFNARDFDDIFYFSSSLTPSCWKAGEMEQLNQLLETDYATGNNARFYYLLGPEEKEAGQSENRLLCDAAARLVEQYSRDLHIRTSVIRLPYLCSVYAEMDPIRNCLVQMAAGKSVTLPGRAEQAVSFLSWRDLAELLYRFVDSSLDEHAAFEKMEVPDCFSLTWGDLGETFKRINPNIRLKYAARAPEINLPTENGLLRRTYHWFPKVSILEEMTEIRETYRALKAQKAEAHKSLLKRIQGQPLLIRLLELLLAFCVTELLNWSIGSYVQFRMVDLRLLFVVLMGSMYGMDMGLSAAVLASLALIHAYQNQGTSWITLFYEMSNWVPFIAYAIAGAACGYLRMRSREELDFLQQENENARGKYEFINHLYADTLHDKREYKKRIIGAQDSFGKIFDITRQLDVVHPQEIFIKAIQVMENVLDNKSIALYSLGTSNRRFARLEVSSRNLIDHAPHSIQMKDYAAAMEVLKTEEVWVNTELAPDYPMYIAAIRQGMEEPVMLIFVQDAEPSQMNLYFKNLLKILAGLVEASLLRAINYGREIRAKKYIGDTQILNEQSFMETLRFCQHMHEQHIAHFTLLKLNHQNTTLAEADEALHGRIRENDHLGIDGRENLYLILNQTEKEYLPLVIGRLEKAGFQSELVSAEEMELLTREMSL